MIIVIIIEFVLLAVLYIFRKEEFDKKKFASAFRDLITDIKQLITFRQGINEAVTSLFVILSILFFASLVLYMLLNAGHIFTTWDAIFSYNRWAIDIYNNKLPYSTYHYPQLIPANWSVAYVICGYPLQFIPKAIMPLFLILQVYSLLIMGIKDKKLQYFPALILIFLGLNRLNWTDGFVDVPVAFFSILTFISLSRLKDEESDKGKINLIFTSIILVCGSAVTKQAGIFLVGIFPLILIIMSQGIYKWNFSRALKSSIFYLAMIIVIIIPYYFYAQLAIKQGNAASEIPYVTNEIYKGATYFERFQNASRLFYNVFNSKNLFAFCIIPFLISFTNRKFIWLNLIIVVPYALIWALFFSYDLRNSALMIPFFCLSIGAGIEIILNRFSGTKLIPNLGIDRKIFIKTGIWIVLIMIIPAIILFNKHYNRERLIEIHIEKEKKNGVLEVNQALYKYNDSTSITKSVVTDYQYLRILPGISQTFRYGDIGSLESLSPELNDESVGFLLWTPSSDGSRRIPEIIENRIISGQYSEIFNVDGYRFIKIR